MNRVLAYEFKSLFLGKNKNRLILAILLLAFAYLVLAFASEAQDGVTALGESLSFYSSIMVFLAPIFAGIFLSQSFENRMIQNSIMSGQKRSSVVIGKSIYFFLICVIFILIPSIIATLLISIFRGWNNTDLALSLPLLLAQALMFSLLVAAAYMVVVHIAFHFKTTASTIGFGLIISILVYSFTQELVQNEGLHGLLKLTPLGNSYFIFNETGLGLLISLAVFVVWTGLCILISWLLFRKEELK